jgi:hypothetical protein
MRAITFDEMEAVSGGQGGSAEVVVTAQRRQSSGGTGTGGSYGDKGRGGRSYGTEENEPEQYPDEGYTADDGQQYDNSAQCAAYYVGAGVLAGAGTAGFWGSVIGEEPGGFLGAILGGAAGGVVGSWVAMDRCENEEHTKHTN